MMWAHFTNRVARPVLSYALMLPATVSIYLGARAATALRRNVSSGSLRHFETLPISNEKAAAPLLRRVVRSPTAPPAHAR